MKLRKIISKDKDLNRIQDNVSTVLDFAQQSFLGNTFSIVEFTLATGNNTIGHQLFRTPTGQILIYNSAAVSIYNYAAPSSTFLFINASAPATVKFLIF